MTTLNLFPSRVRFVNDDGTLTNEAYRALQIVFGRVGGALGDSGTDVFGQVFGAPTDSANNLSNALSDVVQPVSFGTDYYSDVIQYQASSKDFIGLMLPEVMQPVNDPNGVFSTLAVSGNTTIGGTLRLAAGTVGLPSLYWSTDTTTGFYRIGANNNGYSVSGVKLLDFLSTGLLVAGAVTATGDIAGPNVTLTSNVFAETNTNGNGTIAVNFWGFNKGTTQFRDFEIYNGKNVSVAKFTGSTSAFSLSGVFFPQQATTAGAPAYVKGGVYFDTTLNKLRIGGAAAWETVTSV